MWRGNKELDICSRQLSEAPSNKPTQLLTNVMSWYSCWDHEPGQYGCEMVTPAFCSNALSSIWCIDKNVELACCACGGGGHVSLEPTSIPPSHLLLLSYQALLYQRSRHHPSLVLLHLLLKFTVRNHPPFLSLQQVQSLSFLLSQVLIHLAHLRLILLRIQLLFQVYHLSQEVLPVLRLHLSYQVLNQVSNRHLHQLKNLLLHQLRNLRLHQVLNLAQNCGQDYSGFRSSQFLIGLWLGDSIRYGQTELHAVNSGCTTTLNIISDETLTVSTKCIQVILFIQLSLQY